MRIGNKIKLALSGAGSSFDLSSTITGIGSETGQVANGDTLAAAFAKINDRLPLSGGTLTGSFNIYGNNAADEVLVVRAAAGQTADVFKVENSAGTATVRVLSTGQLSATHIWNNGDNLNLSTTTGHSLVFSTNNAVRGRILATTAQWILGSTTSTALGTVTVYGHNAADEALVVRAAAGQTAHTADFQNSAGTSVVGIKNDHLGGRLVIGGDSGTTACAQRALIETYSSMTDAGFTTYGAFFRQNHAMTAAAPSINYNVVGVATDVSTLSTYSGVDNLGSAIGVMTTAAIASEVAQGTLGNAYGVKSTAGIASCGTGFVISNVYGAHIDIQNTSANGTMTNAFGLYIDNSNTTGTITNRYGIYQVGTTALNHLAGPLRFGSESSAPSDGSLANGQVQFWVDDTSDEVKVKAKTASGDVVNATVGSGGGGGGMVSMNTYSVTDTSPATGSGTQTLTTATVASGTLATNGDKVSLKLSATMTSTDLNNTGTIHVYLGATEVFASDSLFSTDASIFIQVDFVRVSSTSIRYSGFYVGDESGTGSSKMFVGTVTVSDLASDAIDVLSKATPDGGTGDVVQKSFELLKYVQ